MKKHKLYGLFTQLNYTSVIKRAKAAGHSGPAKELSKLNCMYLPSWLHQNQSITRHTYPDSLVDILIYSMEHIWFHSDRSVIYPRSDDEVQIMAKSSFKNIDVSSMTPGAIVVASPPGSSIPPMLIGYRNKELMDKFNNDISKQFKKETKLVSHQGNSFAVIFNVEGTIDYLTHEIAEADIPTYALAESTEEVLSMVEKTNILHGNMSPSKEDFIKQANILKFALNIWLYRVANPEKFIFQTPPAQSRNHYGSNVTKSLLLDFSDRIRANQEGAITEVGIHMRNLRHERYYTNEEWKDKPRGSRWVEVGPYTRGGRGEIIERDAGQEDEFS